jgi:hypothetical protein
MNEDSGVHILLVEVVAIVSNDDVGLTEDFVESLDYVIVIVGTPLVTLRVVEDGHTVDFVETGPLPASADDISFGYE